MPNLIILCGIPGSGKSTWARELFDLKYSIVSSDDIRKKLVGSLVEAHQPEDRLENNRKVFQTFHDRITDHLNHGVDVVADATNLSSASRRRLLLIAEQTRATPHLVLFKNVMQAIERNVQRDADQIVPDEVMEGMMEKYYDTLIDIQSESYKTITKVDSYE